MQKSTQLVFIVIAATISLAAGYYVGTNNQNPPATPSLKQHQQNQRPDFALQDLEQQIRHAKEWNGQVVMINFWATWCPPCRSEMPAFQKLYTDYKDQGFSIVGIAIDNKQSVIDFVDPLGIDYPILLGEEKGIQLAKEYGNRLGALPFTVIVDRKGQIIHQRRRELSYQDAEALIKPLI